MSDQTAQIGSQAPCTHAGESQLTAAVRGCWAPYYSARAPNRHAHQLNHISSSTVGEVNELKRRFLDELDRRTGRVHAVVAPGKTATSTVYAALLRRRRIDPLLRAHTFQPQLLDERERRYTHDEAQLRLVWGAQWLSQHPPSPARPWSLVTCVRDPVARLVSVHFQKLRAFDYRGGPKSAEGVLDELRSRFDRHVARLDRGEPDWFELNLTAATGVSVYDHPFDPRAGIGTINTDALSILVLRQENMSLAAGALRAFLGLRLPLRLHAKNVAVTKPNADLYQIVLARFRPEAEWVSKIYAQPLARHFYSSAELDSLQRHWTRPLGR